MQGRIQDLKLGGAHLKKLRRAEGSANNFGVFRVKNRFYAKKNHIRPPGSAPANGFNQRTCRLTTHHPNIISLL